MAASAASSTQDKDPDSGLESTASVSSLSSSVNEQVGQPDIKRRKRIVYDDFSDGTLKFVNGETLRVNMAMLSFQSEVFHNMFMAAEASDRVVEIKDNYSSKFFQMFLNCLYGFEECTFQKAFILLPTALKYKTGNFISQCVEVLTPKEKNIKVCHSLNLAMSCKCAELADAVIKFLIESRYIYFLLSDQENYFLLLKPESLLKILEEVEVDSYIVKIIFHWGKNYLKKSNSNADLRSFFHETYISDFISVFSFETIQALIDFDESELGAGYFARYEINSYIKAYSEDRYRRNIAWFDVKAGDVLVEKLVIKNVIFLADHVAEVTITDNPIVFYELSRRPDSTLNDSVYTFKLTKAEGFEDRFEGFITNEKIKCEATSLVCKIDPGMNIMSDVEIEVRNKFYVDCRLLKSSPKGFEVAEDKDNLCFICSMEVKHFEKYK